MTDLISRLKTATGPSRELDAEIALACGWQHDHAMAYGGEFWQSPTGQICPQPPQFTKYIDVARTLVDNGLIVRLIIGYAATVASILTGSILSPDTKEWEGISYATPAIALVIACLKAREDSKP